MISIDINHPDVMDFIKIKRDLSQVTGANISIKLNNEFMRAVENDEDYLLRFPCDRALSDTEEYNLIIEDEHNVLETYEFPDGEKLYTKKIKAREYWDEIIKSAHNVAEPGLMFWDNMVNYSPDGIYPQFRQVTTNPCSEIGMQPYDACRLIAINLYSFVDNPFTENAKFNFDKFYEINYEAMRLSDDLIDLEIEHIDRILNKLNQDTESKTIKQTEIDLWNKVKKTAASSRRTGLGFTALGDVLAALGLKYDSDESLMIIEKIMQTKMESELDCTLDLSVLRGSFKGSDVFKEQFKGNQWHDFVEKMFPKQYNKMIRFGRRNVSFSTVAPTGTVSLMCQTTSGIEPLFQPYYIRRKKINPNEENVRVDFVDQNGDSWQEFPVLHPKFKDWYFIFKTNHPSFTDKEITTLSKTDLDYLFGHSPWYGSTANNIDWIKRVEIQSIIQKYITHSISSTINLPKTVSEKEVSDIYMESWKRGLKGITVYVDGSRSGVLVSEPQPLSTTDEFGYTQAVKRPKELDAHYYFATSKGAEYAVIVGLMNNKPYEIFVDPNPPCKENGEGKLIKIKKGVYSYISDRCAIDNLQLSTNGDERVLTRWISLLLRHGANPKYVIEQVDKSEVNITSFVKVLARTLKRYIGNGDTSSMSCAECGGKNVVFEEGCASCKDCGSSKCG